MGDRRNVEQEVRRTAERGESHHGIADGRVRENPSDRGAALSEADQGTRGAQREIQPDGLAGGCEGRLRRGGRPEKLAAAPRTGTGPTRHLPSILECHFSLRESRADRLNRPQILTLDRRQCHSARDDRRGQIVHGDQRHHHGG